MLPVSAARSVRPVRDSAIARRSSPLSARPWYFIDPAVSASMIACGDRPRSTSGDGARASSLVWQPPQCAANNAAPFDEADAPGGWSAAGLASRPARMTVVKAADAARRKMTRPCYCFCCPDLVTVMSLSTWLSTEYSVNGWYISSQLCSDQ